MTQKDLPSSPPVSPPVSPPASSARFLWDQAWRAGRRPFLLAILGSVGAGLLSLLLAWCLTQVLKSAISNQLLEPTFRIAVLAAGVAVLRAVCSYLGESRANALSAAVRVHLRHRLYSVLLERGPVDLAQRGTAEVATTLIERVEALDGYIARYLPRALTAAVTLPVILCLLFFISPFVGAVLLVAGVLAPLFMAVAGVAARKRSRKQYAQLDRLGNAFLDRLRNLVLLRTFGAVDREGEKLAHLSETFRKRTMAVLRVAFLSSTSLELLAGLSLAVSVVHLWPASPAAYWENIFALLLVIEFFAPLRQLVAAHHDRAMALAAADVIAPLLAASPLARPSRFPPCMLPEPLLPFSVDFQNVSYTYPGRTIPALQDLSFHVSPGEFVGLKGPTGAGKSTVLSLLLGFIEPSAGLVAIGTRPLESIDPDQRARLFAWVGQRTRIFYGTLADNIRLGSRAPLEAVQRAAREAGLADLLELLPEGLETVVGEQGFGLSGGQAQRVALARAFLRDAPILLLDEPTAGLDRETARPLLATLRRLAERRTVLMVTHDPDALAAADRIISLSAPDSVLPPARDLP